MPVRLRLSLHGNRNNRIFHLVAVDARKRRDAKPIELLGVYDPRLRLGQEHKTMRWSAERIMYWLEKGGALPSKPVVKLLEWVRQTSFLFMPRSEVKLCGIKGRHNPSRLKVPPNNIAKGNTGGSFKRARQVRGSRCSVHAAFDCMKRKKTKKNTGSS
jgi:small subunit ribosomal protein S16